MGSIFIQSILHYIHCNIAKEKFEIRLQDIIKICREGKSLFDKKSWIERQIQINTTYTLIQPDAVHLPQRYRLKTSATSQSLSKQEVGVPGPDLSLWLQTLSWWACLHFLKAYTPLWLIHNRILLKMAVTFIYSVNCLQKSLPSLFWKLKMLTHFQFFQYFVIFKNNYING